MPRKKAPAHPRKPPKQAAPRRDGAVPGPFRKKIIGAVFAASFYYFGLAATLTALVMTLRSPTPESLGIFIGALSYTVFAWVLAFFLRRSAHCPRCKGTPMINSGAYPHPNAFRIPPLNHGITATLSVIAMQRFRCMDCGTSYDLLKPPATYDIKSPSRDEPIGNVDQENKSSYQLKQE